MYDTAPLYLILRKMSSIFKNESGQQHLLFRGENDAEEAVRIESSLEHESFLTDTSILRLSYKT